MVRKIEDFDGRTLKAVVAENVNDETRAIKKLNAGTTYTIQIWQNVNGVKVFRASKTIAITDTTPKYTVVKLSNKVANTEVNQALRDELINGVLQFVQSGQIQYGVWLGDIQANTTNVDPNRLSIYKVEIGRYFAVGNNYEWVDVYSTFEKK